MSDDSTPAGFSRPALLRLACSDNPGIRHAAFVSIVALHVNDAFYGRPLLDAVREGPCDAAGREASALATLLDMLEYYGSDNSYAQKVEQALASPYGAPIVAVAAAVPKIATALNAAMPADAESIYVSELERPIFAARLNAIKTLAQACAAPSPSRPELRLDQTKPEAKPR